MVWSCSLRHSRTKTTTSTSERHLWLGSLCRLPRRARGARAMSPLRISRYVIHFSLLSQLLLILNPLQDVYIHPSTVLQQDNDWLIYNEFVLTTKNYIRTVTHVKPEWLLDIAPVYYDISSFPKGPVRMALERTVEKMKRKEALNGAGKRGRN